MKTALSPFLPLAALAIPAPLLLAQPAGMGDGGPVEL